MSYSECKRLIEASKALLEKSGLAHWNGRTFEPDDNSDFEQYWKTTFDPRFGRYMAWVLFSVGGENLAKAACVCNGVVKGLKYGTLGLYTKSGGHLDELCDKVSVCDSDRHQLVKGYRFLLKVRNRDVHAFIENVRSEDFPYVKKEFAPAFNILVAVMEDHHFDN